MATTPATSNKRPSEAPHSNSQPPKKKAAVTPKRPTPAAKDEDTGVFTITVKLDPKFDTFPARPRTLLEKGHQTLIRSTMASLRSTPLPPTPKYTYNVVIGTHERPSPSSGFKFRITGTPTAHLSLANVQLLETFAGRSQDTAGGGKPTFVELKTKEGLENPRFIHLHAVRHGELGWGVDVNGCLSLFSVVIEGERLRETVLFVERQGVKVEVEEVG